MTRKGARSMAGGCAPSWGGCRGGGDRPPAVLTDEGGGARAPFPRHPVSEREGPSSHSIRETADRARALTGPRRGPLTAGGWLGSALREACTTLGREVAGRKRRRESGRGWTDRDDPTIEHFLLFFFLLTVCLSLPRGPPRHIRCIVFFNGPPPLPPLPSPQATEPLKRRGNGGGDGRRAKETVPR